MSSDKYESIEDILPRRVDGMETSWVCRLMICGYKQIGFIVLVYHTRGL